MTPAPTGQLLRTEAGNDLVLSRTFRAKVEDVWASVTEPDRTARWFGPWEGDAGPDRIIKVQMVFEEGAPWSNVRIDACEPPHRLAVSTIDESGVWRMELLLAETDGSTLLRLVHHLDNIDAIGEVGPGWEYYLDMLVAARTGSAAPHFADYFPGMRPYFDELRTAAETGHPHG